MKKGGTGGGSTVTGLAFERKVDFLSQLKKIPGYKVQKSSSAGSEVLFEGQLVARSFKKHDFYRFLKEMNIGWEDYISAKLLPDDALLVVVRETLFIIEIKFQQGSGSVDEKLQTCDFKKKQYQKLVKPLGLKVEFVYVLDEWFNQERYSDVLEYIESMNCHYRFDVIPLAWLGLPNPKDA